LTGCFRTKLPPNKADAVGSDQSADQKVADALKQSEVYRTCGKQMKAWYRSVQVDNGVVPGK
jgi:hypothetical protein